MRYPPVPALHKPEIIFTSEYFELDQVWYFKNCMRGSAKIEYFGSEVGIVYIPYQYMNAVRRMIFAMNVKSAEDIKEKINTWCGGDA